MYVLIPYKVTINLRSMLLVTVLYVHTRTYMQPPRLDTAV